MKLENLTTDEKALRLNLQPSIYGVFAEIGAGQEVANSFFRVGAASGTIAKTISAYDMNVSDSIYGRTKKYVSKERVYNMLNVEFGKLVVGLAQKAAMKHFFVFADSIETKNESSLNNGHGWMGVKFQLNPNSDPSTCVLHIIFHTTDVHEQRRIAGQLGVNLIYGAYEYLDNTEVFIESLKQGINSEAYEINFIEFEGNSFQSTKNMETCLQLVRSGLTKMIMFGADGKVVQPTNALYKKDVVLVRGRFRPPTKVTSEMFNRSSDELMNLDPITTHNLLPVAELTFRCFQNRAELDLHDLMVRSMMITRMGYPIMITNFTYHEELIDFLNKNMTMRSLNIVLGMDNLEKVLGERNTYIGESDHVLKLIESMNNGKTRILVFPELTSVGELKKLEDLQIAPSLAHLVEFMKSKSMLFGINNVNKTLLHIRSDKVLQAIIKNDNNWSEMVPPNITDTIKRSRLMNGEENQIQF